MLLNQLSSIESLGLLAEMNLSLLFMEILLFCSSIFLMLLILVQRGKGGGLTGALGGQGGQSAFGSKAGDAFTKITVITAVIWIMLCMVTIAAFNPPPPPKQTKNDDASISEMMGADEDTMGADDAADAADDETLGENGFSDGDSTTDADSSDEAAPAEGSDDGVELNLGGPDSNSESTPGNSEGN